MPSPAKPRSHQTPALAAALSLALLCAALPTNGAAPAPVASTPAASAPATAPASTVRTVTLVAPKVETWPDQIDANGDVMPWQETHIATDIGGLRLAHVMVDVGDLVKKGQILARLDTATVEAESEVVNAQLMEAQATLTQAEATLDRAKRLAPSGGVSQQELTQFETQKQTATARLNVARAHVKSQKLKLDSATLIAPDDGVISARAADEGEIVRSGAELFRLIRQGRLEWRAEVKGEMILKLSAGQEVTVTSPLGEEFKGRVRQISPTIDLKTRNGLAYVDLPSDTNFKAGLHVSGTLTIQRKALVLPAAAILHDKDGDRVLTVTPANKVQAIKVKTGRSQNDQQEIISGIDVHARVIASAVDTLKAGDTVTVQDAQKPTQDAAAAKH